MSEPPPSLQRQGIEDEGLGAQGIIVFLQGEEGPQKRGRWRGKGWRLEPIELQYYKYLYDLDRQRSRI